METASHAHKPVMFVRPEIGPSKKSTELMDGVTRESSTPEVIGWVEVDEVIPSSMLSDVAEIGATQLDVVKRSRSRSKVYLVKDRRFVVRTDGNVEFATAIDSVEAVIAGLVEVDEPSCPLHIR